MDRAIAIEKVLDVIAPRLYGGERCAIFDWGHETDPHLDELQALAEKIVDSLLTEGV